MQLAELQLSRKQLFTYNHITPVKQEDEETAMRLESLRANMPLIRLEYGKMLRTIQRQKVNMEDIANKVRNFKRYSEVEVVENIANAFIK